MSRHAIEGLLRAQNAAEEAPMKVFICPICGAYGTIDPPHGWNASCPIKEKEVESTVAANDARRMTSLREASAMEDMTSMLSNITGRMEGDDE